MVIHAEEIDYNEETGDVEARRNIRFEDFRDGEKLQAERIEYNVRDQTGKFFDVKGTAPIKMDIRPGLLRTDNPFYFQGRWAERLKKRYIVHQGFVTDCRLPNPWWILRAPTFDVIPGDRAIVRNSWFRLKGYPIFFFPFYYKSLKKEQRGSGFLVPNIGNSSRRGKMFGVGYYWAINRSYDMTYSAQLFTQRGFAHHYDFRGVVRPGTEFDFYIYGVNDRGTEVSQPAPGYLLTFNGKSNVGRGWTARGEVNYLSSLRFRQEFTESFHEAIAGESHSVGFLTKHWNWYGANFVFKRLEDFQSIEPNDRIVLRKLPELNFVTHERQIRSWQVYFSLDSTAGLVRRNQPLFQTRQFVERLDFAPRLMTQVRWKDVELVPWVGVRETYYGSSFGDGRIGGSNLVRSAREAGLDLILPSFARVWDGPSWLGEKVKHVIEPRATYRYVSGVSDFNRTIRFDEIELWSNTNEVEFSLTNRLLRKTKDGNVSDALSWEVWYKRYFDPSFGGAVVPGQRNIVQSAAELTGYAFLDRPRHDSPIVSVFRVQSRVGIEWRADYDALIGRISNSVITVDARRSNFFASIGHTQVRSAPVLSPNTNQFRGQLGWGADSRRGWNAAFLTFYDFRQGVIQYTQTQVTYNTDCCGLSVQFRRLAFGSRNENQIRVAFAVANLGTFGTLKRQEKIF
jgi:LPS-assembly protein